MSRSVVYQLHGPAYLQFAFEYAGQTDERNDVERRHSVGQHVVVSVVLPFREDVNQVLKVETNPVGFESRVGGGDDGDDEVEK